jgi:light-regulated signal transduction histidine kinase (bacteriophytochrome)
VVHKVKTELERETANRVVEWRCQPLPFVECDPSLMEVVFTNLLSNAVKYTRPRTHAVIEVGAFQQNGQNVIFVRDNGVGFSMKYAQKLFGVFQRLHRAEDFEGTGVGLATVQRILHKHGGSVWAESELDKGATFYFTLDASQGVRPVVAEGTYETQQA